MPATLDVESTWFRCRSGLTFLLAVTGETIIYLMLQQGAAGAGAAAGAAEQQRKVQELQQQLQEHQKQLNAAKEEAQRSAVEMERLLQLVQMSQEEQNTKDKQIHDLHE